MADPQRYRISVTYAAQLQFALLQRRAALLGVSARVISCFHEIDRRLEAEPTEWGEPSHMIRSMRMTLYTGFHDRMLVSYGVHESQPEVVVRGFEPQFGHPLYRDTGADTDT